MLRWRHAVVLVTAIVSVAVRPTVLHGQSPVEIRAASTRLALIAEALRTDQLGGETLYSVAVYAASGPLDLETLANADVAKALRIEVVSDDDPNHPLTRPWRRELVPRLDLAATTHLRAITAPVRKGDVLLVEYEPGRGTTIRGNKTVVTSRAPHGLMIAFLDHWLGQRPVSEDVKRILLERG
jgi:hypothetical protein